MFSFFRILHISSSFSFCVSSHQSPCAISHTPFYMNLPIVITSAVKISSFYWNISFFSKIIITKYRTHIKMNCFSVIDWSHLRFGSGACLLCLWTILLKYWFASPVLLIFLSSALFFLRTSTESSIKSNKLTDSGLISTWNYFFFQMTFYERLQTGNPIIQQ